MAKTTFNTTATLLLHLLASGLATANSVDILKRQESDSGADDFDACIPTNSTGYLDLNAPCVAWSRIQQLCVYGEQIRKYVDGHGLNGYSSAEARHMKRHSAEYQRDCICSSQQFDQMRGCMACYDAHGGDSHAIFEVGALESFSSSYCAASATPTAEYPVAILELIDGTGMTGSPDATPSASSASLGSQTDVSLYYTPSATGSQAWDVILPTGESATFSDLSTSDGQIVPTAVLQKAESRSDTATTPSGAAQRSTSDTAVQGASSTSEGGAMATGVLDQTLAVGVLGFAALVAAL